MPDQERLQALIGKLLGNVGGAMSGALVLVGDKLGLYRTLVGAGPLSTDELAARTGTAARYVARMECRSVLGRLKPDGTWMVVEPFAQDRMADNLNPIGRLFCSASTMICVPAAMSQEGRAALGAQAGEARLLAVIRAGGFTRVAPRLRRPSTA